VEKRSRYIFHDISPPQFDAVLHTGRALIWRTFGAHTGGDALLDSKQYAQLALHPPCGNVVCCMYDARTYLSPWATSLTPLESKKLQLQHLTRARQMHPSGSRSRIYATRSVAEGVHLVGGVGTQNARAYNAFARGCRGAGIPLHGHDLGQESSFLAPFMTTHDSQHVAVPSQQHEQFTQGSWFVPCVQGAALLDGEQSYIADRALLAASYGTPIATNNPAVFRLFQRFRGTVLYDHNLTSLCSKAAESFRATQTTAAAADSRGSLMQFMQEHHVYTSRLRDMLFMFQDLEAEGAGVNKGYNQLLNRALNARLQALGLSPKTKQRERKCERTAREAGW
jgi:hypothetical protein